MRGEVPNARRESCLGRRARVRIVEAMVVDVVDVVDGQVLAIAPLSSNLSDVRVALTVAMPVES